MDASQSPIWFIGDLDDPWIVAIAEAIARVRRVHRVGLSRLTSDRSLRPGHPSTASDRHPSASSRPRRCRCGSWTGVLRRRDGRTGRVPLHQPLRPLRGAGAVVRLVDLVVSEATAAEVLPGTSPACSTGANAGDPGAATPAVRIEVAGGNDELCRALVEACGAAGYRAEGDRRSGDRRDPPRPGIARHPPRSGCSRSGKSRCSSRVGPNAWNGVRVGPARSLHWPDSPIARSSPGPGPPEPSLASNSPAISTT